MSIGWRLFGDLRMQNKHVNYIEKYYSYYIKDILR